jgi:DNA polymerase III subunit delta'
MAYSPDKAFQLVKSAYDRHRLAHAFLISGPRGCGKEDFAARLIQMVQRPPGEEAGFDLFGQKIEEMPKPLDELAGEWVRIVRPQSKSRRIVVDSIRELEKSLYVASEKNQWKVGVIADADRMVVSAENAFLKTLEEPPPRTLLLLLTANPGALLPTVLSRCVRIPLLGKPNLLDNGGEELVSALNAMAQSGFGSATAALSLKSVFSAILDARKEEAVDAADALMKEEEKAYKNIIEGDYLKRREEALKAAAESEYLSERARLFDVLQTWLGDVLRSKSGSPALDLPECADEIHSIAEKESVSDLLRRMDAISQLRSTLDTNAQEQLALEVGFLKAFA